MFVFGLARSTESIPVVAVAVTVGVWALLRLRAERDEHAAASASWAASEAVLAERLRIARDLHDVVSHGLGMITVRAATARHLHARDASAGASGETALLAALDDVESASRQATLELRHMLQALRESDESAPRHPTDGLAALPSIVADAERAGIQVGLQHADLGDVPAAVQLTICAVAREGLANAARHAGSTRVRVLLTGDHDAVTVTVADDGPAAAPSGAPAWSGTPGAGHGLIGLRERVAAVGGALEAGPCGQGYRLHARLPKGEA